MRNAILILLLIVVLPLRAADRELTLARQMLEDAIIRDDVQGMELMRERLLRIAGDADDRTTQRDAHYLIALSSLFETFTGLIDVPTGQKAIATGIRHADRAIELDPQFAGGWLMSAMLRGSAPRWGLTLPKDPPGTQSRFQHAAELDANSTPVAFFTAMYRSFNPNGAAPPEAMKMIDDLAGRLDADRAATRRPFGLWDAEAHAWQIFVRRASDAPPIDAMRALVARLTAERPDFVLGQQLADAVAERHFVPPPSLDWQPFLTDAAGDGKRQDLPDLLAVDRAESGDKVWYRYTVREPLPRAFGVNLVINRSGDLSQGASWWGATPFKFDRLVTVWIVRDGDRYFGTVGVTDAEGARGMRMAKFPDAIDVAISTDDRAVIIGVPRSALGLTDASKVIAAVGSHLVWNDDATSIANSR